MTKSVFIAVREIPRRFMGPRVEPRFEAELRELVDNIYQARGRVSRATRDAAEEAGTMLARRRGWRVEGTLGWVRHVADPEIGGPPPRRTELVDRGLIAIANIIGTLRQSIGEEDDPAEKEAVDAALRWIWKTFKGKRKQVRP